MRCLGAKCRAGTPSTRLAETGDTGFWRRLSLVSVNVFLEDFRDWMTYEM